MMCDVERKILLMIKALGVNYPILRSWSLGLAKLLLLIVEPGQGKSVLNVLCDKNTFIVDEFMTHKDLKSIFMKVNSNLVIFSYRPSVKANVLLDRLSAIAVTESYAGCETKGIPLVVSECLPLGFSRENAFTIYLEGDLVNVSPISLSEVVPPDDQLPVVADRINSCMGDVINRYELALIGAAGFLYPIFPAEVRETTFESLVTLAESLVEVNEENQSSEGIEALALQEFFNWQERTDFSEIYELPYLEEEIIQKLTEIILFDEEYIWISEVLFKEIMSSLHAVFPITILKQTLSDAGIIVKDSLATYTTKMSYYDFDGEPQRKRRIRIRRARLTRLGEQGFVELCLDAKERKYELEVG